MDQRMIVLSTTVGVAVQPFLPHQESAASEHARTPQKKRRKEATCNAFFLFAVLAAGHQQRATHGALAARRHGRAARVLLKHSF
jgi:hypothetical protein